jgi:hypothetical protein
MFLVHVDALQISKMLGSLLAATSRLQIDSMTPGLVSSDSRMNGAAELLDISRRPFLE